MVEHAYDESASNTSFAREAHRLKWAMKTIEALDTDVTI